MNIVNLMRQRIQPESPEQDSISKHTAANPVRSSTCNSILSGLQQTLGILGAGLMLRPTLPPTLMIRLEFWTCSARLGKNYGS
jgi:hypothetical protein